MLLFRKLHIRLRSPLSPLIAATNHFSSIATLETPPPSPTPTPTSHFAVNYLIQSCGLPSDKATHLSRYLPHLKSSEKPDAVLQFLRQAGVSQPHIKICIQKWTLCCNLVCENMVGQIEKRREMCEGVKPISSSSEILGFKQFSTL